MNQQNTNIRRIDSGDAAGLAHGGGLEVLQLLSGFGAQAGHSVVIKIWGNGLALKTLDALDCGYPASARTLNISFSVKGATADSGNVMTVIVSPSTLNTSNE
jgi:hypothetical protein